MNDIVLRDLRAGEAETLVEIALAAWEPIYAFYRQSLGEELFMTLFPDWRQDKARQIRAACEPGSPAGVCVAERAGRVVGFVTYYIHDAAQWGEIGNNAVRPDCRGQGIAPRLYEHVIARMKEAGMRYVKVVTGADPAHAPARRAYEKVGFDGQIASIAYYRKL